MLAGPSALLVALCLIPGWLYWRLEGTPRTARTTLSETFEVVVASALSVGVAVVAYLYVQRNWVTSLASPRALTAPALGDDALTFVLSVWVIVGTGAFLAVLAALTVRAVRRRRSNDSSFYDSETSLWVSVLGGQPAATITVDVKSGERFSGYLGSYEVTDDGATPAIRLLPPIVVRHPTIRLLIRRKRPSDSEIMDHDVVLPGSEIVAIWVANSED